ncbi:g10390 [Coccomyxa viridis]|uniref:G10390 protein n=1 Tax=Coccomyxa viridis TaxID=1274662 RepID=A0ABP1GCA4_9CHLO
MDDDDLYPPQREFKSNADFRQMLQTPRAQRGDDGDQADGKKPGRKPDQKKKKSRPKPEAEGKEEDDESGYRDRAEERRRGKNPDYEDVQAQMATLATGNNEMQQGLGNISVENSKFLGGDLQHTHLVKGLDYALLQKVRGELEQSKTDEPEKVEKVKAPRREDTEFHTSIGRGVFDAIFNPPKINVSEQFLPRRTAFLYELDDEGFNADIPTTLRRSKADCPPAVESMLGSADGNVLERIAKIMSYMRPALVGKSGKRLKRKEKLRMLADGGEAPLNGHLHGNLKPPPQQSTPEETETKPAKARAVDDDDDIFGDAGTNYEPELPKSKASNEAAPAPAAGSYFDKKDEMADLPALPKAEPSGNGHAAGDDDMEVEDGDALPPPPLGPAPGPDMGPARPPADYDAAAAYADPAAYEAYLQSSVAYQASTDPEYQALLAKQQGLDAPTATQIAAGLLSQQQKEAGLASVFKRDDENLARRREVDEREKDPAFVSDAYAECYPGYHDYNNQIVDSEDEADYTHMDSKLGKSRTEFNTEEEWQEYKSNKEMMPKAAFQFGVKATDGRKMGNKLGKARDNKINTQLNKIQSMLEKDSGDKYKAAFAAPEAIESGKVSKKRRI